MSRKIRGVCPSCRKKAIFDFIGEQEGALELLGKRVFWYNCKACGTTVSRDRVKEVG